MMEPAVLVPVTQVFPQAVFKGICDLQTFTEMYESLKQVQRRLGDKQ